MLRILILWACAWTAFAADRIEIDLAAPAGPFRPLNGLNKGPLVGGGLIDLSADWSKLKIPFARLHDCRWPNPDVADMHVVFPKDDGNPALETNYDFRLTDEYLKAIKSTGSDIIYRLGESIEHTAIKRFVHPPPRPEKWAQICLGIIRHYNEGWASGFRYGIKYWEIWNEPENQPAMWTGTDAQYFELYRVASRAIKSAYPHLKVGGPAIGASGSIRHGKFEPSVFLITFLELCRREKLPLDFFSWHCYTADPAELVLRSRAIRALLDDYGFRSTESHLNEWNYLPENDWKPVMRGAAAHLREAFYRRMGGPEGAAFVTASYILLQDAPLDLAAFFHGELGGFGLFNEQGVPNAIYSAFAAIAQVLSGERVSTRGTLPAIASWDRQRKEGWLLMANSSGNARRVELVVNPHPDHWVLDQSAEIPAHSTRLIRVISK